MKCSKLNVAAAMLLLAAGSHGQPAPSAVPADFPTGGGAPPAALGAGFPGSALPEGDGIPPPHRGPDEDGVGLQFGVAKLSDRAPKPSADPRNFEGSWYHRDRPQERIMRTMLGNRLLSYTDAGRQILKHRREMENAGTPVANASAKCYPTVEFALEINAPFYIVQSKDSLYFVFEEFHDIWQVRLNQQHKLTEPRSFKGDSIGYWDGNTLVIETLGYREPFWLDFSGTPASKDARITRRMRKIDTGRAFEIVTTVDDPQMYKETWSFARTFGWAPDKWIVGEYNCEQQVGGKTGAASYGVVEEGRAPR